MAEYHISQNWHWNTQKEGNLSIHISTSVIQCLQCSTHLVLHLNGWSSSAELTRWSSVCNCEMSSHNQFPAIESTQSQLNHRLCLTLSEQLTISQEVFASCYIIHHILIRIWWLSPTCDSSQSLNYRLPLISITYRLPRSIVSPYQCQRHFKLYGLLLLPLLTSTSRILQMLIRWYITITTNSI